MPRVSYKVLLDAPLEAVWAFYEDVEHGLAALSPPGLQLRITRADRPAPGAQVTMRMKLPPRSWVGRETRWTARFTDYRPPRGQPPHREASFVDEQVEGPFKSWRHEHRFSETLDEGRPKVRVVDDVAYGVPLGPIGLVLDRILIRPMINRMFAHRHRVLRERLSRRPA